MIIYVSYTVLSMGNDLSWSCTPDWKNIVAWKVSHHKIGSKSVLGRQKKTTACLNQSTLGICIRTSISWQCKLLSKELWICFANERIPINAWNLIVHGLYFLATSFFQSGIYNSLALTLISIVVYIWMIKAWWSEAFGSLAVTFTQRIPALFLKVIKRVLGFRYWKKKKQAS